MSSTHDTVSSFEDSRWSTAKQKVEFRHRAALELLPDNFRTLLDVGCGEGTFLGLVRAEKGSVKLAGADMSDIALGLVSKRDKEIVYVLDT